MSILANFPSELTSRRITKLEGALTIPGDKSISHRAAILGGLAKGSSRIRNFLCSEDCLNTLYAMISMDSRIQVHEECEGYGPTDFTLTGCEGILRRPESGIIDCGNSGTGIRLLAGVVGAQPFECTLTGDNSLQTRPMGRILTPLAQMGVSAQAIGAKEGCAPLLMKGSPTRLHSIDYTLPMASAQVKSCILLAGLFANGTTTVRQPAVTRDHTERLFTHFGIDCTVDGLNISVEGGQIPSAQDLIVPGDISSAAFWLVAAAALPGSCLSLNNIGLNPTRTAVIDVLKRMGADIQITPKSTTAGEPYGDITVKGGNLTGTSITREEVPNLIDEIPILAVAGALAKGTTTLRNAKELRVKETDRITTVVNNLRAMGAQVEEYEDGLVVTGGHPLQGAILDSYGDHRIAMSFLIAGLFADGTTTLKNTSCIATSYPGFDTHLGQATFLKQSHPLS